MPVYDTSDGSDTDTDSRLDTILPPFHTDPYISSRTKHQPAASEPLPGQPGGDDGDLRVGRWVACVPSYVDMEACFRGASLALHHGGAGTSLAALRAGVPQLLCPFMFDQPEQADQLTWLGVHPDARIHVDDLCPTLLRPLSDGKKTDGVHNKANMTEHRVAMALRTGQADLLEQLETSYRKLDRLAAAALAPGYACRDAIVAWRDRLQRRTHQIDQQSCRGCRGSRMSSFGASAAALFIRAAWSRAQTSPAPVNMLLRAMRTGGLARVPGDGSLLIGHAATIGVPAPMRCVLRHAPGAGSDAAYVAKEVFCRDVYRMLKGKPQPHCLLSLDIGAHIGMYTVARFMRWYDALCASTPDTGHETTSAPTEGDAKSPIVFQGVCLEPAPTSFELLFANVYSVMCHAGFAVEVDRFPSTECPTQPTCPVVRLRGTKHINTQTGITAAVDVLLIAAAVDEASTSQAHTDSTPPACLGCRSFMYFPKAPGTSICPVPSHHPSLAETSLVWQLSAAPLSVSH